MTYPQPKHVNHWCRHAMNQATQERIFRLKPELIDVLEISGDAWSSVGFRSYQSLHFPNFDLCRDAPPSTYDLVIAEQVFEHVADPMSAARNVLKGLRKGGSFLITLPFLIKYHPEPLDLWRWTASGLKLFLERAGFGEVATYSWGNKECVIANLEKWVEFDASVHSLENDARFPIVVWGIGHKLI